MLSRARSPDPAAPRRKPRLWRWLLLWLPLLFVVITTLQVLSLRWIPPPTSMFMLDRRIDGMFDRSQRVAIRYQWRSLSRISPWMPVSVIASEDQKFFDHHGFDMQAINKAMDSNQRGRRVRGASTISQQVAKNLFLWSGRNYLRKGLEAWYTVLIEALWPKRRIVEVYVNIAEFGDGIYGVEAASQAYFHKSATHLSASESARLAAVLPSPRRWSVVKPGPFVQRHARWIERQVRQLGGLAWFRESIR
ncbi:MAG: monofunctional biosynthetic peptidoglycan transglycosylase [Thermomonas sp.]